MSKRNGGVLTGLAGGLLAVLIMATPAAAEHNPAVGGQFCRGDHAGNEQTAENGEDYVCEERGDDTQPRWYPVDASDTTQETEETESAEESTPATESDEAEELPLTGVMLPVLMVLGLTAVALGWLVFILARRRRVTFTA